MGLRRVILSLNEIETTILKTARGAGMEWGLAEEAANAARWFAAAGAIPEMVFLHIFEAAPWRADIVFEAGTFRPGDPRASLCPIRVGACLSDLADILPLRVERVLAPLLLLPFAARLGQPVALSWNGLKLGLPDPNLATRLGDSHASFDDRADLVEVTGSGSVATGSSPTSPRDGGAHVDGTAWQKLQTFAARTYVPASERSRLMGAGAGRIDNE